MVEFVSYDGLYPCLCFGTLVIKVNGEKRTLKDVMVSGGCICKAEDSWDMWAEEGDWDITLRKYPDLLPYKDEIVKCVNENVEKGCCGGCI